MKKNREAESLINDIKQTFPDVAEKIDARIAEFGDTEAYTEMFEAFSEATNEAIKEKQESIVSSHFEFMSQRFLSATDTQREYIDVYYVEPLMWYIRDNKVKAWAWGIMPENLKKLYIGVWGKQTFNQ